MAALPRILCLSSQKPEKGFVPVREKFKAAGFELFPLSVDASLTPEWVAQHFTASVQGVLFNDEPLEYVRAVGERLRAVSPSLRFLPLYYCAAEPRRLEELEETGLGLVADFFLASELAPRMGYRLRLRQAEYTDRAAVYRMAQEQSSKLAAADTALKQREEFLGVCAHDLRSPLGLIQTCLSMVLKSEEAASLKPIYGELLSRAHRQSNYALTLVKDLLDVTALDQGLKPQYQVLKLHDLLNEFYKDYGMQAQQKKIEFHYYNPVQDWLVLADSERIKQLLQNLFANALKFTEAGKNIYLNAAPFQGRRKGDPPYPMVVISLKDEGKGIPQSELQKIFDRFVQIKEQSREGGRGLGLTVAKQISTLHDGNIWVESEQGRGSTFFVLFPHTLSEPPAIAKQGEPKNILVVEPSEEKRRTVYGKLKDWGYQVEFAKDGVEAITYFYHLWPDALVLASELGKITTPEVANMLKSDPRTHGIPVLLAAGSGPAQVQRNESVLADAVLPMPFTHEQWKDVLGRYSVSKKKAA